MGRELLPAARRVLAGLAAGLAAARAVGSGRAGCLRLGFAVSLAWTVLPGLPRGFGERYPGVRLAIRETTRVPQRAVEWQTDCVLVEAGLGEGGGSGGGGFGGCVSRGPRSGGSRSAASASASPSAGATATVTGTP